MADFPVYKCVIDDTLESELQVEFVSLVDKPAIEKNFLAFATEKLRFIINTEKQIVSGPAMIADMLIYRNDVGGIGEYYATFDKEAILSIVQKFFKKGYVRNFNLQHDPKLATAGVTIYESFLVDRSRGIMPMKGFEDAPDGSWFLTAKVDDAAVWEKVKAGEVKGFSVEGLFKQTPAGVLKLSALQAMQQIKTILENIVD